MPKPTPPARQDDRQERLARALRDNLRRRKEQERAREAVVPEQGPPQGEDSPA